MSTLAAVPYFTALSLIEAGRCALQGGTYAVLDPSFQKKSFLLQKISQVVFTKWEELQTCFHHLNTACSFGRLAIAVTCGSVWCFVTRVHPAIFLTMLSAAALEVIWPCPPYSMNNSMQDSLLFRITFVVINTLILIGLNLASPWILACSAVSLAALGYSLYKDKQIKWMNYEATAPIENIEVKKQGLAQAQESLELMFRPRPTDRTPPSSHLLLNLASDESLTQTLQRELSALQTELADLHTKPIHELYSNLYNNIRDIINDLRTSIQQNYSQEIINTRIDILSKTFSRGFDPTTATTAQNLLSSIVNLQQALSIQSVTASGIIGSLPAASGESCTICFNDNPDRQICPNGHALHESCLEELWKQNMSRLLPGLQSQYTLVHTILPWPNSPTHDYRITIEPSNRVSCPACRGPLIHRYTSSRVHNDYYGLLDAAFVQE